MWETCTRDVYSGRKHIRRHIVSSVRGDINNSKMFSTQKVSTHLSVPVGLFPLNLTNVKHAYEIRVLHIFPFIFHIIFNILYTSVNYCARKYYFTKVLIILMLYKTWSKKKNCHHGDTAIYEAMEKKREPTNIFRTDLS